MELVYSTQNSDFDPEKRYRNPAHFDRPEAGVTHAVVIGSWPKVIDAYEALGVEVSVLKPLIRPPVDSGDADAIVGLEQDNAALRAERDGILRLIDAAEGQSDLEHPAPANCQSACSVRSKPFMKVSKPSRVNVTNWRARLNLSALKSSASRRQQSRSTIPRRSRTSKRNSTPPT